MLSFDPVPIGNNTYQLQEIVFNDALKVAAINQRLNEKRISAFLSHALCNKEQPLNMTIQERYCLMLKYVEKQSGTLFSTDADFSKCYLHSDANWQSEITRNGITVRQLVGREAEYLEEYCANAAEWIACMLAFQISYSGHEALAELPNRSSNDTDFFKQFSDRLAYLKQRPQSDFDLIYQDFIALNNQLFTMIHLNVSNQGLVISRGADDAPLRFRPAAAFFGIIKELDQSFA
ncbi:hypothetical protein [Acinetobacter kyonggiensis]|uniref:Uncharacterized protein n=1 Tax=Acinetobacter kyonggiensis TaxID=595670 RepID=A0A1H3M174_9GAMM|nr:hypothetical protein [Acinetobacter kyonggiensis]SDY70316.1 hypothetical protein SAMN05421643_12238 [Acinetobacter kyonggiensis]